MIRVIFIIFIFYVNGFSYGDNNIISDYKNGNFEKVCIDGTLSDSKNEDILSLIGNACLKVDFINPLGIIVKKLISSPEYRENASYFATILLQKKLIYQFMNDGVDLHNLRLPRTSYILSVVFENLAKKNYKITKNDKIEIDLKNSKYILWRSHRNPPKVYIDEYKNGILLKHHWYL